MAKEIELKLALGQSGAQRLAAHPRLVGLSARHETLTNTYYDTPAGDLERHRVALRLRRTPHRSADSQDRRRRLGRALLAR